VSPGARRDPSMVAIEKPEAESDSETVGVGQSLARHTNPFGAASSKLPARVGSPDHLLKKLEGPQKTRQNAPVQSSARLYFSKTTSPPKAAPSQQLDEVEASTPPDQGRLLRKTQASSLAPEQVSPEISGASPQAICERTREKMPNPRQDTMQDRFISTMKEIS